MRLAEAEIAREARRVLRRLAAPRMALFKRQGDYAVARGRPSAAASRLSLGEDFAAAFLSAGWIMPDGPERFLLSAEGRAFLVRSFGGEDRFAEQHREMQTQSLGEEEGGRAVKVNLAESPLARLKSRELVDAVRFAAGERLRRDFTLGQLTPRMGVDYSAPIAAGGARGTGAETLSDIALAARQRLSRAMAAMGPGLSDLAFDVCCDLQALERAEARRGWSRHAGRVVLLLALERLAAHYGMTMTAPSRSRLRAQSFEAG
jgi:hypothetical protein